MAQIPFTSKYYNESYLGDKILSNTPGLSLITKNIYNSVSEVYNICFEHKNDDDKTDANLLSLAALLKYNVITTDGVKLLVDNNKLRINKIEEFLAEYEATGTYVINQDLTKKINDETKDAYNTITNG